MKKLLPVYAVVISVAFIILLLSSGNSQAGADLPEIDIQEERGLPQLVRPVVLKDQYHFAGEPLPMDNFDVRQRLKRELTVNAYWHSSTVLNLQAARRYFPLIEPILKANGIPEDFKYLAVAESNLRNAVSPAGAKGLWQIMQTVGEHYGLESNRQVEERYHPEKATEAACTFLLHLKERFGSWTLAAAAYNVGETSLARELSRQKEDSYYDMNLNQETDRYLFRIVALREILNNPSDYGYFVDKSRGKDPILRYRTVRVKESVESWADFAHEHGTTYRMLKVYNPWMLSYQLDNRSGKIYEVKLPR